MRTISVPSAVLAGLLVLLPVAALAAGDPKGLTEVTLTPTDDTWATHDDGLVHGLEPALKVGIERQACLVEDAKNICTPKKECCAAAADVPAYCAPPGECAATEPAWDAYRKFHTYLRFELATLPKGAIVQAYLRMRIGVATEKLGGPVKVVATRLKKIGSPVAICGWDEDTLNDTNGTTWSSLPQNVAPSPDGQTLIFDVTKAVRDWTTGDTDYLDAPVAENCGFHLYDPDFGKADAPIERWITFSSKEGDTAPTLIVTVAQDLDGDGATAEADCNEADPTIHPGAADACADGLDSDCSGGDGDEVCDGVDNDCDGTVDESDLGGPAPCGPGLACANHQCVKVCEDTCAGPFDTSCLWNDATGVWVVQGCTLVDGCHAYVPYQACNPGQKCEYGSCSFNCLDDCDAAGVTGCVKDSLGVWHVAECGNFDVDECLEWQFTSDCKPGASCADGACGSGGCEDLCDTPGQVDCTDGDPISAVVCLDSNGDGCLDQSLVAACASNECAAPLGCVLPGAEPPPPPPPDAGPEENEDGGVSEPPVEESPVELGPPQPSEPMDYPPEVEPAAAEEVAAEPPAAEPDAAEPIHGSEPMDYPPDVVEAAPASDANAPPAASSSDGGCATGPRHHGGPSVVAWVLLGLALVFMRRSSRRPSVGS